MIRLSSLSVNLEHQQQTRDDKLFRMLALWWRHEYDNDLTPDDYALLNQLEQELNAPVTKQQSTNQPIHKQDV